MKRVILHIGQPKTGSTAIQFYLDMNVEEINRLGIDYYRPTKRYTPWRGGRSNAHFLMYEALTRVDYGGIFQKAYEINPSDHEFMLYCNNEESRKELKVEIERFKQTTKDYDTFILSEEMIYQCIPLFPNFMQNLKQIIEDCFEEEIIIDCLLYLRRQDMWILSKYKEGVRNRTPWSLDFNQTVEEYKRIGYFDYNQIVLDLEKVFGKDHVIIRDYDRKKMIINSIVPDFFYVTNITYPRHIVNNEGNKSLTTYMSKVLFNLRKGKYHLDPKKIEEKQYNNATSISIKYPEKPGTHFLSKEERIELVKEYEQGNKELGKRYTDNDNFFNEIDDDNPVIKNKPLQELFIAINIASDNPFLIKLFPLKVKLYNLKLKIYKVIKESN